MVCKHGYNTTVLTCLTCNPNGPKNKCTCNNTGTCALCKVFKPICEEINDCCDKILKNYPDDDSKISKIDKI